MPMYSFECSNCGHTTSMLMSYRQKKMLKNPGPCPICYSGEDGELTLYSVIGKTNFILKGGGWYKDGY